MCKTFHFLVKIIIITLFFIELCLCSLLVVVLILMNCKILWYLDGILGREMRVLQK